ncbi:MAG TPA: adenylate/guanylate cyclase domain-containing protein [Bacteroidales bacterium]|nr:adenylate/guanylate cyclase domain-containing protein [Bacteroidales bacterium]HPJ60164.1 adenylate/guanylate cyclase domain-containing protein [Bacteroidales bacterium]HPR13349.1 adenylate/guanylate cyclase domain-containing protein [Bacteroidales bacterium]
MTGTSSEELVRRIARLAKQNQELEDVIKKLSKQNDRLSRENERLKALVDRAGSTEMKDASETEKTEKSLKFNMATVLFADIHGFSKLVEGMDSSSVMDELDEILFEFDAIVKKYNIEKIKTIGDTFMCAGGIPEKNITNPVDVVMAALEMRNLLETYELARRGAGNMIWDLKIGIHTGPVTASVSGKKKINYDIKGDTVNTASRVEAVSEKGTVVISVMTYELVKEFFDCEYFGKLPVKYKEDLQLYLVRGLKPEFSVDGLGKIPNEAFRIKFGLIQFTDIQEVILDKLEKELPSYLFYHNVKHTVDVVTEVELIGWAEGCSDEEILLLKTAALFHDAGHTMAYDNHEYHGTIIARQMLPAYNYSAEQIEKICSIIMATKLPPRPANLLEEIICDSDLDYLGRSDFIPVSNTLFEELKAQNKMGSLNDWNKLQVKFISGHQYFTRTARSLREVNKQLQIERIQSLITE